MSSADPGGPRTPDQRRPSRVFSILMGLFGLLGGAAFISTGFTVGPLARNLAIGLVFGGLGALWLLAGLFLGRPR